MQADILNTAKLDQFLKEVEALKASIDKKTKVKEPVTNTKPAIKSDQDSFQTSQALPENTKKYMKWAVLAGAGWALYEVFTAGEEES